MNINLSTQPSHLSGAVVAACAAGALLLSACGNATFAATDQSGRGPGNWSQRSGNEMVNPTGRNGATASAPAAAPLGAADADGLLFMREEEKLARDVYTALYTRWQLPIFASIANSEETHTSAIARLIARYGLVDPATTRAPGQFQNSDLQALYDRLVEQGSKSRIDALTVGATIEDLDLTDLAKRASAQADIQRVYANLAKGSRNHLRAFTAQLAAAGADAYEPQYLTATEYNAIVNSAQERGPAR